MEGLRVTTTGYFIDRRRLLMVAGDNENNLLFYRYDPARADSDALQCVGDIHAGSRTTSQMLRCAMPEPPRSLALQLSQAKPPPRYALVYGTHDGGVQGVAPIDELGFKRLELLQVVMTNALRQRAGLNPRSFRRRRWRGGERGAERLKSVRGRKQCVADFNMLDEYLTLDRGTQRELARAIGTSVHMLAETLTRLHAGLAFF